MYLIFLHLFLSVSKCFLTLITFKLLSWRNYFPKLFSGWKILQRPDDDVKPVFDILILFTAADDKGQSRQSGHLQGIFEADGGHCGDSRTRRNQGRWSGDGCRPRRKTNDKLCRSCSFRRRRRFRWRRFKVSLTWSKNKGLRAGALV